MEMQIGELVAKIREEAVDKAKAQADEIVAKANEQAGRIEADARKKAQETIEEAQKEVEILNRSAKEAASQAVRDAVLLFKANVSAIYDTILTHRISESLDDNALASLLKAAVDGKDVSRLSVELSQVSDLLKANLADLVKQGLEIKPVKGVNAGFRLCEKDGSGYYDFSDEALAAMLKPFLGGFDI